jgi:excisionase family DNA binding protein
MNGADVTSERLLTLRDIQASAGVSRVTAWRWTQEHGLRVIRVGRCVRIRERDWLAFLAKHTSGGESEGGIGQDNVNAASNGGTAP